MNATRGDTSVKEGAVSVSGSGRAIVWSFITQKKAYISRAVMLVHAMFIKNS